MSGGAWGYGFVSLTDMGYRLQNSGKECEDKMMLHFCHPSDYAEFGEIGAKLYGLGPKIPSWMG